MDRLIGRRRMRDDTGAAYLVDEVAAESGGLRLELLDGSEVVEVSDGEFVIPRTGAALRQVYSHPRAAEAAR